MRRLIVSAVILTFLAACGGRRAPVTIPTVAGGPVLEEGIASYYAEPYHGRQTANGETFDTYQALTAAHRTLPFHTVVRVTNLVNGREVDVRINDRGPFIEGRVIDLSLRAAQEIDMVRAGVVPVRLRILPQASASPPPGAPRFVYTVQVGAFENPSAADALMRELERRYSDVYVETFSSENTFYRVRVGRADNLASAEQIASRLRGENFDPFIVRMD